MTSQQLPILSLIRFSLTLPRLHRIGCSTLATAPTELLRFIEVMEQAIGRKAIKDFQPMQPGDVVATAADTQALADWVGFKPSKPIEVGVREFAVWFKEYYKIFY